MKTDHQKISRILGFAFLFQFITSFSSGVFLKAAWFVPDNMSATLLKIANTPWLLRTNIFVDMLTAVGVTFLGVMLYLALLFIIIAIALLWLSNRQRREAGLPGGRRPPPPQGRPAPEFSKRR